ncbi:MAG: TIGR00266 family protein [Candidatus Sericytochromatia bacterium]|nr:TIGR00266 family protein [Candidatus Sericytochromatia bacterium]
MKTRLLYPGTNSMIEFNLEHGEAIKAESGAMVAMSSTLDVDVRMEGGILGGLSRRFLSGENFFFETLRASRGAGHVLLAPSSPGDVVLLEMDGSREYNVQKGSFLAGSETIQVNTKMQNLAQGFFSGEGFFILKITGTGTLALNSFGAIYEIKLSPGEEYIVDNHHLVAWPTTTSYTIEKASKGWISSFTSGEGLVCKFKGPGKIYIQTRNPQAFGAWIKKLIPITAKVSGSQSANGTGVVGDILDIFT